LAITGFVNGFLLEKSINKKMKDKMVYLIRNKGIFLFLKKETYNYIVKKGVRQ